MTEEEIKIRYPGPLGPVASFVLGLMIGGYFIAFILLEGYK
jgi:hypothetical protein